MGPRPTAELIQALRVTLEKLEENFASTEDQPVVAELKRILLLRIADIEAIEALQDVAASEAAPGANVIASEAQPVEPLVEQTLQPAVANAWEMPESSSSPSVLLDPAHQPSPTN